MKYNFPTEIKTKDDVKAFVQELADKKATYHLDDDADDIYHMNGKRLFTNKEAKVVTALRDQAYDVCDKLGLDIFELLLLHNRLEELNYLKEHPEDFEQWQEHHEFKYADVPTATAEITRGIKLWRRHGTL